MYRCPQSNRLEIIADHDPTLLGRVCGILGGLSLIPTRLESATSADTDSLHITIVIAGCTPRQLDLIQRKLSQLTSLQTIRSDATDPRRQASGTSQAGRGTSAGNEDGAAGDAPGARDR
jgi:acetolactate synthase regulatory subunit